MQTLVSNMNITRTRLEYSFIDDFFEMYHLGEKCQAFLAFSLYSNGKKLLSYEIPKSTDKIRCLDGIRVITTLWILVGHLYTLINTLPIQNKDYTVAVSRCFYFEPNRTITFLSKL